MYVLVLSFKFTSKSQDKIRDVVRLITTSRFLSQSNIRSLILLVRDIWMRCFPSRNMLNITLTPTIANVTKYDNHLKAFVKDNRDRFSC